MSSNLTVKDIMPDTPDSPQPTPVVTGAGTPMLKGHPCSPRTVRSEAEEGYSDAPVWQVPFLSEVAGPLSMERKDISIAKSVTGLLPTLVSRRELVKGVMG